jgi:polyphosphate kinase 2 (PPK2 family)
MKNQIPNASKLAKAYEVDNGKHFRLNDVEPADTRGLDLKEESNSLLQHGVEQLSDLQQMLYAQNHWALLLIFQAMDAAGKDGAIRHVMSGVNPQGCQVYSFKAPSTEELDHDFLWRTSKCLPERGRIGIFNRSYYEEVLIIRVHPEIMAREPLSPQVEDQAHLERTV